MCFAPVLTKMADHPHNKARNSYKTGACCSNLLHRDFPPAADIVPRVPVDTAAVLADYGFTEEEIAILASADVVAGK